MSIIIAFLVNHKFRHGRIAALFAILTVALLISPRMMHSEGGPGDLWQTFSVNDGLGSGSVFAIFPSQDGAVCGLGRRRVPAGTMAAGVPLASGMACRRAGARDRSGEGRLALVWHAWRRRGTLRGRRQRVRVALIVAAGVARQ